MQVRWFSDAVIDLIEIEKFIAKDKPGAAHNTARFIKRGTDKLKRTPAIGKPGRVPLTRELIVTGTPYIIPYRVRDNKIEILRALHGARKWPEQF